MTTSKTARTLVALGTAAALAIPATAVAKGGGDHPSGRGAEHGSNSHKPKSATYVFKGLVSGVGADGSVQVQVAGGNSRGRGLKGQTLTFDVSTARLTVADVNGDGKRDLGDVAAGDRVVIQAKLPATLDTSAPLAARRVVDQGPVKPADDSADDDGQAPVAPATPTD